MPCDRTLKRGQTIQMRAAEIRRAVDLAARGLTSGKVKAKVSPQGAITFVGLTEAERDDVTDGCMYRRLLTSGSALALQAIAAAEALAGRSVDKQLVAQGAHAHTDANGVLTWHDHK